MSLARQPQDELASRATHIDEGELCARVVRQDEVDALELEQHLRTAITSNDSRVTDYVYCGCARHNV
eukprot:2702326-Pleurochrysis_carterae.AAC.2